MSCREQPITWKQAKIVIDKLANKYRNNDWWQGVSINKNLNSYYVTVRVLKNYNNEMPESLDGISVKTKIRGGRAVAL